MPPDSRKPESEQAFGNQWRLPPPGRLKKSERITNQKNTNNMTTQNTEAEVAFWKAKDELKKLREEAQK